LPAGGAKEPKKREMGEEEEVDYFNITSCIRIGTPASANLLK
jgi:hypothetical protein